MAKSAHERAEQARWFAVLALAAGALYLCWTMLQPFIGVLIIAIVLVIVFDPLHVRISKRVKRPNVAAFLSTLAVLLILVLPLAIIAGVVVQQLPTALNLAREMAVTLLAKLEESDRLRPLVENAKHQFNLDALLQSDSSKALVGSWGEAVIKGTMTVVGGLFGFLLDVFFALFTIYYLFRDGDRLRARFVAMLPLEQSQTADLTRRACDVIRASVYGVLVIAVVQGGLGGVAFWMLGVAAPVTWGVVMTIASIIPVIGSVIIWGPAALYLLATGHPVKALILALWGALIIGMADNVLRPRLVGRRTDMHELLVFFSVLGGLKAFGAFGFLLGPSLLAVTLAMMEMLQLTKPLNQNRDSGI